ncbi:hypothetical protein [Okeania sp. SIO1I7]|uniref:hypothetical protein n=1 Tax=Okeania sp. SIO1I7 TaxID=2607772 RepID=UPI0013F9A57D|nr:hypothetical protein [Okeania sp. SIO1I7]NET26367.1 hypothetical protein [Okeania sp. SIO1I7]
MTESSGVNPPLAPPPPRRGGEVRSQEERKKKKEKTGGKGESFFITNYPDMILGYIKSLKLRQRQIFPSSFFFLPSTIM